MYLIKVKEWVYNKVSYQQISLNMQQLTDRAQKWFSMHYVPSPKGKFRCRSLRHQRRHDSLLSAWYLMNQLADLNQICLDITLEYDEDLIRFWWSWLNFQGRCRLPKSSLLHVISWAIGWNVTKFVCLYNWNRINSWLDFADLDLIFKVTVKFEILVIVLQLTLDRNTIYRVQHSS